MFVLYTICCILYVIIQYDCKNTIHYIIYLHLLRYYVIMYSNRLRRAPPAPSRGVSEMREPKASRR